MKNWQQNQLKKQNDLEISLKKLSFMTKLEGAVYSKLSIAAGDLPVPPSLPPLREPAGGAGRAPLDDDDTPPPAPVPSNDLPVPAPVPVLPSTLRTLVPLDDDDTPPPSLPPLREPAGEAGRAPLDDDDTPPPATVPPK